MFLRRSFSTFKWEDPLLLHNLLTDEERQIQKNAEDYSSKVLFPRILKEYAAESLDTKLFREMGSLGFFGCNFTEFGLPGISPIAYGLISRAIERADGGYRTALGVQNELVIDPIIRFASSELKERLIPKLVEGSSIGAFGLTEPNHGSDPSGMETKAVKKGPNFIISGTKCWISHAPIADVFVVWGKYEGKVHGFVLERGMAGLDTSAILGKLSLRTSPTGFIHMDNVEVPPENKLNVEGMKGPLSTLMQARYGLTWGPWGAAEFCLQFARDYTIEREQFGKPLASMQLIQKKLADMATEITLGLHAAYTLGRNIENHGLRAEPASMLKRNACAKALKVCRDARDILGGNGIIDEYHVMRHSLNLESVNTYEGTQDIHTLLLGRAITGLSSFN